MLLRFTTQRVVPPATMKSVLVNHHGTGGRLLRACMQSSARIDWTHRCGFSTEQKHGCSKASDDKVRELKARPGKTDQDPLKLIDEMGKATPLDSLTNLYRLFLDTHEKTLWAEHPNTLDSVTKLALSLKAQDKLAEAEPLCRRALQGHEKTLGAHHPLTLTSVHILAVLLHDRGKLTEAEPLYRKALEGRKKIIGVEHPETLLNINNLASVLTEQGQLAEAEPLYRMALQASPSSLEPQHQSTLTSAMNLGLGVVLIQQGRLAEARSILEQAVSGFQALLGPGHPITFKATQWLRQAAFCK
eukprot:g16828.t1